MTIHARYAIKRLKPPAPQPSPVDFSSVLREHTNVLEDIANIRAKLAQIQEEFVAEIQKKLDHVDNLVAQVRTIQKGDPGEPGAPAPAVDEEALVARVLANMQIPDTPSVDEEAIARRAAKLIKIPSPQKGDPGKNAEVDHEKLANIVLEEIKKGKKLTTEHIGNFKQGLEQTIAPIRSLAAGFRGGGDTVAAGTNVTITTVNGVKTISAAGGGFTTLAATQTPDGSVTVFTFASASAQPSFIISDNTWLQATTKKGTVNWTWNAGAKQATMMIPPQDEILAIV